MFAIGGGPGRSPRQNSSTLIGRTRCSSRTAMIRSSANGSWPTKPATPACPVDDRSDRVAALLVHGLVERVRQETQPQRHEDRSAGPRPTAADVKPASAA